MTVLKIMCGAPASGKSRYIERHKKDGDVVISRDIIRQKFIQPGIPYFSKENEVFDTLCKDIDNNLIKSNPNSIWVDATHLNHNSRKKLISNIRSTLSEKVVFVCVETPLDICLKRNATRDDRSRVPESALKSMYNSYKRPTLNEFDYLNTEIEVVKENDISNI